jgi:hypothetical protein
VRARCGLGASLGDASVRATSARFRLARELRQGGPRRQSAMRVKTRIKAGERIEMKYENFVG